MKEPLADYIINLDLGFFKTKQTKKKQKIKVTIISQRHYLISLLDIVAVVALALRVRCCLSFVGLIGLPHSEGRASQGSEHSFDSSGEGELTSFLLSSLFLGKCLISLLSGQ